jgi:hypothetical protein
MYAIEENKLTPEVRNEVVRDLVTHMYGFMEKPTSSFCKYVAQRLILKYKFMRDSKGTGLLCALSPIIVHSCTRVLGKRNCLREL